MKHRILYSTLLGALLSVLVPGCISQLSETPGQMKAPESFTAEMGDADGTKTTLADDKTTVLWRKYDDIDVFYSGFRLGRYTNYAEEDSPVALFVGNATTFVGATVEGGINKSYWAVYPAGDYDDGNTSDGNSITTQIRDKQTPVPGNIEEGALVTIAKSETTALQFYHVCGGIKFSLTHEGIQQVEFKGNNGEAIAGKVKVTMDDTGRPKIISVEEPQTSITMLAPSGEAFETGTWYYLACAPVELTQGFTLTLRSETETGVYTSTEPVTVKRAIWGTLTNVDDAIAFEPGMNHLYDQGPNEIRYTTYDGSILEVVHPEVFDAKLVSNTYKDGQGLMVFDGPITRIGRFYDYSETSNKVYQRLTSVDLPNSIREIGEETFRDCLNLTSIRMPRLLNHIKHDAFQSCKSLTSFDWPESITEIENNVFFMCSSLRDITIPKGVKSIGWGAFAYCYSLESTTLPEGLLSIKGRAFADCYSLSTINLPEGLTEIGSQAFSNCKLEGIIDIPTSVTTLDNAAFSGNQNISGFKSSFASADGRCLINNGELIGFATYQLPSPYTLPSEVSVLPMGSISTKISGTLVIPATVQTIKDYSFSDEINTLTITSSDTIIEENAFSSGISISNISGAFASSDGCLLINNGVILRGTKDLNDTGEGAVYSIASGPTRIEQYAFSGLSSLKEITVPNSITSIAQFAFLNCTNLADVILPDSIETIDTFAFGFSSTVLESVTILRESPPTVGQYVFGSYVPNLTIYVPAGSVETYKAAEGWSQYASKIQEIAANGSVYAVELDHTSLSIKKNNTADLVATVKPSTATDKSVTWSSSDESVATVDLSGKITAVGYGEAVITVTTNDGQKTAQCKVEVPEPDYDGPVIESFTFSPQEIDITTEAQTVTVKFHITDKSGVQSGPYVYIQNQDNVSGTQQTGQTKLESGTAKDGVYSVAITIPAGLQPGEWSISANPCRDIHNNQSSSFLRPTSEKKTLTVINNQ